MLIWGVILLYLGSLAPLLLDLQKTGWNSFLQATYQRCCFNHPIMAVRVLITIFWPLYGLYTLFLGLIFLVTVPFVLFYRYISGKLPAHSL